MVDCESDTIISKIYDFLRDRNACTVFGAFVVADPQFKLFGRLVNGVGGIEKCSNVSFRSSPLASKLTHAMFVFEQNFKDRIAPHKQGYTLDSEFRDATLRNHGLWTLYEKKINLANVCGTKVKNTADSSVKKVVLFYPFVVVGPRGSRHEYLFIKTEGSAAYTIAHIRDAAKHYIIGDTTKKTLYPIRRESEPTYDHAVVDAKLYRTFVKQTGRGGAKMINETEFYNNHVRAGNELFVPTAMINSILAI